MTALGRHGWEFFIPLSSISNSSEAEEFVDAGAISTATDGSQHTVDDCQGAALIEAVGKFRPAVSRVVLVDLLCASRSEVSRGSVDNSII